MAFNYTFKMMSEIFQTDNCQELEKMCKVLWNIERQIKESMRDKKIPPIVIDLYIDSDSINENQSTEEII